MRFVKEKKDKMNLRIIFEAEAEVRVGGEAGVGRAVGSRLASR